MAKVSLQGVSKYYGKVQAVKKIDLEIINKEFLVLVGPSGCGKSSSLRIFIILSIFGNKSVSEFDSADITRGVLASSIKMLSTSSTMANAFFLKHKLL